MRKKTMKHPKCLYCGNPDPAILKRYKPDTKEVFRRYSGNLTLPVQEIPVGFGGSYEESMRSSDGSLYLKYPLVVECAVCGSIYSIISSSGKKTKKFVKQLLKNIKVEGNMEGQIAMFMKKEGIKWGDIIKSLKAVTLPLNKKDSKLQKLRRFLKRENIHIFHILFKKYFLSIYKTDTGFIVNDIRKI